MAKPRLALRRKPVLDRGKDTMDDILKAASQVFSKHGYAHGTTNRIAARAGVSIGSVYQYFPNKDSILLALVRKHMAEGTSLVLSMLGDPSALSEVALPELVERFVRAMLALHEEDPRLHRVLFEEAPHPKAVWDELGSMERTICSALAGMLGARPGRKLDDPELTAWIVVQTVEALVHRFVIYQAAPAKREAFVREAVVLVSGYLTARHIG